MCAWPEVSGWNSECFLRANLQMGRLTGEPWLARHQEGIAFATLRPCVP